MLPKARVGVNCLTMGLPVTYHVTAVSDGGCPTLVEQELRWALEELRRAGVDTPQLDAEVLMAYATGLTRTQLVAHPEHTLSDDEVKKFRVSVCRRSDRYPLAYITGKKEFWGLEFEVNPSVLIPRPETELIVEAASEWLRGKRASIAEIGVGSGAIAVALAMELPDVVVYGTEISPEASETAIQNARSHSVSDRVRIFTGDLDKPLIAEGLAGTFDAVVSNPPYISSDAMNTLQPEVLHEPHSATVAGPDPLCYYRRILESGPKLLKPGGRIFLEMDPDQSAPIAEIGHGYGLELVEVRRDLAGMERMVILQWSS